MKKDMERFIINFLEEKLTPSIIYLFGSMVKGTERQDSDVDIAFVGAGSQIDGYDLFLTAQELASHLNQEVDLIDLDRASTVFQAQVIHTGKVLYCRDEQLRAWYEMKVLKMYSKLNEERAFILKNVKERGRIYEE